MAPTLKLTYFPLAGRAEGTRLALTIGGIPFEDKRITGEEWGKTLKGEVAPKQMPLLEVDGKMVGQSVAMLRYAGKLAKYDGKALYPEDPLTAFLVDEMVDITGELFPPLGKTFGISDQAEKEAARAALVKEGGDVFKWAKFLDGELSKSTSGYAVGDSLTIADVAIFSWVSLFRSGWLDGCPKDCFDNLKNICAHKNKIASIPQVQEYYKNATGFDAIYKA